LDGAFCGSADKCIRVRRRVGIDVPRPRPKAGVAISSGPVRAGLCGEPQGRNENLIDGDPVREILASSSEGARLGAIRVYRHRPVVVFSWTFLTPGRTSESFPILSSYPKGMHHLTYTGVFGGYSFDRLGDDGPWVFFDDQANTFIISPASHFMNAARISFSLKARIGCTCTVFRWRRLKSARLGQASRI
jgi:hypothetical protein